MTTTFSSWLFVLFGMLLMDTVLCVWFLHKFSEGVLELTVTALIFIIAKLLEQNPIKELNDNIVFICIAAGAVAANLRTPQPKKIATITNKAIPSPAGDFLFKYAHKPSKKLRKELFYQIHHRSAQYAPSPFN